MREPLVNIINRFTTGQNVTVEYIAQNYIAVDIYYESLSVNVSKDQKIVSLEVKWKFHLFSSTAKSGR